jgi:hypothetical protein
MGDAAAIVRRSFAVGVAHTYHIKRCELSYLVFTALILSVELRNDLVGKHGCATDVVSFTKLGEG